MFYRFAWREIQSNIDLVENYEMLNLFAWKTVQFYFDLFMNVYDVVLFA